MPKKQKRDNAYYEARLKKESPTVWADLKAGKYKTVAEAKIAAGISAPRTRLQELKNAFSKATVTEQADFLTWLGARGLPLGSTSTPPPSASVIAVDRRLVPTATARIKDIMSKRGLKRGDVLAEMGYSKLNPSLGRALHRGDRLQPDMIAALEKWLAANASI